MEGSMDLSGYSVVKETNEWTICNGCARIMTCRSRRTAIKTVRLAAELLKKHEVATNRLAPATREAQTSGHTESCSAIVAEHADGVDVCGREFPGVAGAASETAVAEEAGLFSDRDEHGRLTFAGALVPMDDVVGDSSPRIAVEPLRFVAGAGLDDDESDLHHVGVAGSFLEWEARLRGLGELGAPIPFLYFWGLACAFGFPAHPPRRAGHTQRHNRKRDRHAGGSAEKSPQTPAHAAVMPHVEH
ncbi:MAG TPA: hypothetical protein VGH49_11030 [Xanthobacteraceae bacterium]